ncbi:unnamed protein product [Chrysoparadoxa australica]
MEAMLAGEEASLDSKEPPEPWMLLALGSSPFSRALLQGAETSLLDVGDEGFIIRVIRDKNDNIVIAADGNPMGDHTARSRVGREDALAISYGAVAAAYAVLESLGFGFLHPLEPLAPERLRLPELPDGSSDSWTFESPQWPYRAFHVHTQHPLELTDVLQGFDFPMHTHGGGGNSTQQHQGHCEENSGSTDELAEEHGDRRTSHYNHFASWESMLPEVESFFEWCAANRVNRVEWLLLGNSRWNGWGGAGGSKLRQERFLRLTSLGHAYGLLVGIDVPLGLQQQHTWYMVSPWQSTPSQIKSIRDHCDWISESGFDFISTEAGLSEFTNPGAAIELDLMNAFAEYSNHTLGLPATIKVHCSTHQTAATFEDPRYPGSGKKLNFNYLPTYASPELGVMPHTVQAYGLDDPVGGVYGNGDWSDLWQYMMYEAEKGEREVIFYGESSYWVSVDIDVPLLLPVYGQRRLHDLRLLAAEEKRNGIRISGQMNFDSGWEWGYWLNDVIIARAAWNPHLELESDDDALAALLMPVMSSTLGDGIGTELVHWVQRVCRDQYQLLLLGLLPGEAEAEAEADVPAVGPFSMADRNSSSLCVDELKRGGVGVSHTGHLTGIAYLAGADTWFDIPRLLGIPMTQPNRVHLHEHEHEHYSCVMPLLDAMTLKFQDFSATLAAIAESYRSKSESEGSSNVFHSVFDELRDGMDMLNLRARQVQVLYQATHPQQTTEKAALMQQSRDILGEAASIVRSRESNYRVPVSRIATWHDGGPTAYRYGYLWAVSKLYFWWRDHGRAEQFNSLNFSASASGNDGRGQGVTGPCYLNRIDPSEMAFGWGKYTLQAVRLLLERVIPSISDSFTNCLAPPVDEYEFPRDLHRYSGGRGAAAT